MQGALRVRHRTGRGTSLGLLDCTIRRPPTPNPRSDASIAPRYTYEHFEMPSALVPCTTGSVEENYPVHAEYVIAMHRPNT